MEEEESIRPKQLYVRMNESVSNALNNHRLMNRNLFRNPAILRNV